MARGDFGKAYALYRQGGGTLDRKAFGSSPVYPEMLRRVQAKPVKILPPDLPDSMKEATQ